MSERPTPETDAEWACFKGYMEPLQDVKDLSHKLERERDEAREDAARWESSSDAMERAGADQARRADENREWALKAEKERDEARELVKVYQEYTKLLVDEINDTAALAYVHGWKTNRYEEGKVLREKIKQLEKTK